MLELVADSLATWRLVRLLHSDLIAAEIRASVIGWSLKNGHPYLRSLIQCRNCLGVWAAAIVLGLRAVKYGDRVRDLLAVAGASSLLFDLLDPSAS